MSYSQSRAKSRKSAMIRVRSLNIGLWGWYAIIVAMFNIEAVFVALHGLPSLEPWQWLIYPFAVVRIGRLLTYDGVMQFMRNPFTKLVPHWTGVGEDFEGREGNGLRSAIGNLLACPICSGTHGAMVLLLALSIFPAYGLVLLYILAAVGAAEILFWFGELLQHAAFNQRRQSGGRQ